MNCLTKILGGLGTAALLAGVAPAQRPRSADRLASGNQFITEAAQGGAAEVEMGRLAVQHASNARVKEFAQRMIDDHSKAGEELKSVASKLGVTVPSEVNSKQKAAIDKLARLNGAEFDRAYMQDMIKDHREDVSAFKKEAESGDNPDVKKFVSQTLPTLQDHLKMAEEIQSQVKK
jgi:putative membrane protein